MSLANPGTPPKRLDALARPVGHRVISTMRRCLARNPKERATIPELLLDPLLTGVDEEEEKDAPPRKWFHYFPTCGT